MIRPDVLWKQLWDGVILLLTLLASIEIPIYVVFRPEVKGIFAVFDWLYLIFFAIDIILNFFTTWYENGKLVSSRKKIRQRYLKTWFAADFIAAFPFEVLHTLGLGTLLGIPILDDQAFLRSLYMAKVLRLARLIQYIRLWQRTEVLNPSVLRLVTMLFWVGIFSHWIALGWLSIGRMNPELDEIDNYILAFYWTITTLTTIGYGDITPNTNAQYLYTMGVQLMGVAVFGYIIGNVTSVLANLDTARANFREKMDKISAFMRSRDLPAELQKRIRDYYNYLWETRRGSLEMEILGVLPRSLQVDVALALNSEILRKVPLFQNAEMNLIRQLVLHLQPVIYLPGDIIFHQGEIGHGMYFIARGKVEILNEETGQVYATLPEGSFFGEMSLLFSAPRNATAKAVDYCDLYRLDKETFDEVLHGFPVFEAEMRQKAAERTHPQ